MSRSQNPQLEFEHILSWLYKEAVKSANEPTNYTQRSRQIGMAMEQILEIAPELIKEKAGIE